MARKHILTAGPAVMPEPVLERLAAAVRDYKGRGQSVLELSHRSADFVEIHARARDGIASLLGLSDDYVVLFLQGGASTQFAMLPMSFLPEGGVADYALTGAWSMKARKEAERYGRVKVACTGAEEGFRQIPGRLEQSGDAVYLHYTSNNTIYGTEWSAAPESEAPLICDASSDILSRPIDMARHAVVYGGAQKNLGPSGVTLVIMRRDWSERVVRELPTMLDYRTHIAKDSAFNTPPTFGIYAIALVCEWLAEQGGLSAMAKRNERKARRLYELIDGHELYRGHAALDSRSLMNVTFRVGDEGAEKRFLAEASELGFVGLKGHRSVGGCRASIYNALPDESVTALCDFMSDFAARN